MPHLNLLYPFHPASEVPSLLPRLEIACRRIPSFRVELSEVRAFEHGPRSATVWLAPEPGERIRALHRALLEAFPACDHLDRFPEGFTPHLSLGQARGRGALASLLSEVRASWSGLAFPIEEVAWIARSGEGRFEVRDTVSLGPGGESDDPDPDRA